MFRKKEAQAGFSYIELLVTASVLVVLASVAVPMFKWDQKRRKEAHLRVHLEQMRACHVNLRDQKPDNQQR